MLQEIQGPARATILRDRGGEASLPSVVGASASDLLFDLKYRSRVLALALRGLQKLVDEGFEPGEREFDAIRITAEDVCVLADEVHSRQ
jgi:hypothetical protein